MIGGHGLGLRPNVYAVRRRLLTMTTPITVERKLSLPTQYRAYYDQGAEGACVGFGFSWMMSILNRKKYDAYWLYQQAQLTDEFLDTPPGDGTSETAASKILIDQGHRRVWAGVSWPASKTAGIAAVRFASSVDELRACILAGVPFGCAVPWYENFDAPQWTKSRGWVIGEGLLGNVRGWHFICAYGARDSYGCFDLVNSWGNDYPLVKIPYSVVERLMQEDATFAVVTDR